ncbi:MerR family transcriptional regulator [Sinisalibacter aestuarii]|uniref:HTH merR-type domain-containing protein n=1 Tax=Sinisalibacter aestuarii TaxID=2949426 RepID=A0ABQ5LRD8_9RHOB|nr:MerR family transcriptional regulator [Sinisalibacter aestuarii]GKY87570.1 hypothetical protein STA1M1_14390 [Sinisalibacter aestuarii]
MDQKSPEAFRTISEVADWLGVPTHVLRFWESRFAQVKPVKRAGGRRYYRPADMELLGGIRKLLHEDGMTIRGVQKLLREQGVKHVAAMSPALDTSADTRDVTPDNVVDLSDRRGDRAPEDLSAVEDAEIVQDSAAEPAAASDDSDERRFPFDDEPQPVAEAPEAEPAAPADEPDAETTLATPEPDTGEPVQAATDEPEPAGEPQAAEDADADTTPDIADPLPEPETMEFFAHDAAPDMAEETAAEPQHEPAPAEPVETDAADPMSSPDALDFAAHDATPELAEEPAAPALVMPGIGPDPEDDAIEVPEPLTLALRAARQARTRLPAAHLQALADRLDELARHNRGGSDQRGGL